MPKSGNIAFVYSATGEKLRKTLVPLKANGQIETQEAIDVTDYMGEYIYRNNILSRIINTEGACVRQSNGSFVYEYDMKDHLGNTRVTFSDVNNDWTIDPNTEVSQINHYYPYGLTMVGNWNGQGGANKYQYNSKEWNGDYGLDWNDYGARFYDPAVVRWWNLDPECESGDQPSVNPYHYVYNNPISHTDPNGKEPEGCCGGIVEQATARMTGLVVAGVDNLLGTNLRDVVGSASFGQGSLRAEFDAAVTQGDKLSLTIGGALIGQSVLTAEAGGLLTASVVGSEVGIPALAVAGVEAVAGTALSVNAARNLQNSQVKANADDVTHQTYTKENKKTGEVYSGRTSGKGTPAENVADRDKGHHMNEKGFGPAKLDKSSPNKSAIRGREQQLIDKNGGAKSQGGTSGNAINGIGDKNPKKGHYMGEAKKLK